MEHKKINDEPNRDKESFEHVPLHTACLTYLGFYLLMILGFLNQLFFTPKVATEKDRKVISNSLLILGKIKFQVNFANATDNL